MSLLLLSKGATRINKMEKFVVLGQNKSSSTDDARHPRKKIKLEESAEWMKEEEEEDEHTALGEFSHPVPWQKIEAEGLDCDYALLFSKEEADRLFKQLEEEVVYATGTTSNIFLQVMSRSCCLVEPLWPFLFQGKKQRCMCLERCAPYQEGKQHMETKVSPTLILG